MQIARRRARVLIRAFGLNIARGGNVSTFNSIKGETVRPSKKRCRTSRVEIYTYIYIYIQTFYPWIDALEVF